MTFKEVIAQWTDKTKEIGVRINNKVVTIKFCPDDPENKLYALLESEASKWQQTGEVDWPKIVGRYGTIEEVEKHLIETSSAKESNPVEWSWSTTPEKL